MDTTTGTTTEGVEKKKLLKLGRDMGKDPFEHFKNCY